MGVYFFTFVISFIFSYIAEKHKEKLPKTIYVFLILLAILIPSALAGFRAFGIGTDTKGYLNYTFYDCLNINTFAEFRKYIFNADVEPLFIVIDFIITRFTDNINFSYFVYEFILLLVVYIACQKIQSKKLISVSFFIFLILYFNRSLNMCRQSIALAFILLSMYYLVNRKLLKFLLIVFLAFGFHSTSLIIVPFYFLYNIFNSNTKKNYAKKILFFVIFFLLILFYKNIVNFLITHGILSDKYLFYLNGLNSNISIFDTTIKFFVCVVLFFFQKIISKNNPNFKFFNIMYIVSVVLIFLGLYSGYAQRLAYYFEYIVIFLLPDLRLIVKESKQRKLILAIIILFAMMYSYICYDYFGWDDTVPYKTILIQ